MMIIINLPRVVQFIERSHGNLESGIDSRRKKLSIDKDPKRHIPKEMHYHHYYLPIVMMPLNQIHKKCTAGYKLSESQEKINRLMYMDDIKLFARNKKHWKP